MSGIAAAVVGGALVGGYATYQAGQSAEEGAATMAQAQAEGTALSVAAQREQLAYLKEINRMPQQYRESALRQLGERQGIYTGGTGGAGDFGVAHVKKMMEGGGQLDSRPGTAPTQTSMIAAAKESPLYAEIMGARGAGEEAILRGAGATGGLRSGGVQESMYDYNVGLQNTALLQAYKQQEAEDARRLAELQGLAGIDTGSAQVAQTMGNIGATQMQGAIGAGTALSQGQIAQGQIYQQGLQGLSNTALTGLSLGIQAGKI